MFFQSWMKSLHTNCEVMCTGITPQMRLLKERSQMMKEKRKDSMEETEIKLATAQTIARKGTRRFLDDIPAPPAKTAEKKANGKSHRLAPPEPLSDANEVYDNNEFEIQKDKIRTVFLKIDKDGNGRIDIEEFSAFIDGLGTKLDRREIDLIFNIVDKDKNKYICFDEFVDYFVHFIMDKSTDSHTEAKLRTAFLKADRDGSGAVNFREFSEFAYGYRRSMAMSHLMTAFDNLDVDNTGEIEYDEFRDFFLQEEKHIDVGNLEVPGSKTIEECLKGTYEETDVQDLAKYLRSRWNKFASFKRYGDTGKLVMKGASDMVQDIVPGSYTLVDLACFNDLPPLEPKKVVIKGVKWIESSIPGKSGRAIFPSDFDPVLPVEFATNELLAYYGSSLASSSHQQKICLLYRHGIQDFTYENTYLDEYVTAEDALGGAGMEHHKFSHLDCPLEEDSGYFVMGKFVEDEFHVTAFKVPTRHTLYVPPDTIHSNDYLKGTWRTMLSDEADVNHVQLMKMHRKGNIEQYEHFTYSFKQ